MLPSPFVSERLRRLLAAVICTATAACVHPEEGSTSPTPAQAEAAARAAIASERSIDVATIPEGTVGVPPFAIASSDTNITPLAFGLADLLITDLSRSSRLTVVDRIRLDAMLRELNLLSSGAVDSAQAPRVGKLLGARRLIVGALGQLPNGDVVFNAKVADVATSGITTTVSGRAPLARVLDAETQVALNLFNALGVTLTPAERAAIEAHPTQNITALIAYSRGVREEAFGRYGAAAQQFQAALVADPGFTNARTHLSAVQGPTIAGANAAPSRKSSTTTTTTTSSTSRAIEQTAASVNPSLADVTTPGATGTVTAVSTSATTQTNPVQRELLTTIVIFIRPQP